MPRIFDVFFNEHAVVAEARFRLRRGGEEAFAHLIGRARDAHALAAAAGARLDHDRIADAVGDLDRLLRAFDHAKIAGHGGDLRCRRRLLALDLVAHRLDGVDVRPDERDAGRLQRLGEGGILRQKAVARMDRFRARLLGRLDDLLHHEIGLRGGRRPDQHRLVGHIHMHRVAVRLGIDRHRLDAHPPGGLHDTAGDFAAIGDQNFVEHGGLSYAGRRHYCGVCALLPSARARFNPAFRIVEPMLRNAMVPLRRHCKQSVLAKP